MVSVSFSSWKGQTPRTSDKLLVACRPLTRGSSRKPQHCTADEERWGWAFRGTWRMEKHCGLVLCSQSWWSDRQPQAILCVYTERGGLRNTVCQWKSFYGLPDSLPTFWIKLRAPRGQHFTLFQVVNLALSYLWIGGQVLLKQSPRWLPPIHK